MAATTIVWSPPRSSGQVEDVRAGLKVTSAGSSDKDAKDWQVNPAGKGRGAASRGGRR